VFGTSPCAGSSQCAGVIVARARVRSTIPGPSGRESLRSATSSGVARPIGPSLGHLGGHGAALASRASSSSVLPGVAVTSRGITTWPPNTALAGSPPFRAASCAAVTAYSEPIPSSVLPAATTTERSRSAVHASASSLAFVTNPVSGALSSSASIPAAPMFDASPHVRSR
jgi:hypothetical protein